MAWFQLDTASVIERSRAGTRDVEIPSAWTSLQRGIVGFTVLSVAGFAPWALLGRWFYRHAGEAGLYAVCGLVFIGLSGPLLHKLILGPGSLSRFYKLFAIAFAANSVLWIAGWMSFRGHTGSIVGLFVGTAAMAALMVIAFEAWDQFIKALAVLFVLNTAGYFVGGWIEAAVIGMKQLSLFGYPLTKSTRNTTAMLLWGVCYGIGFGAGLGLAFYFCQRRTRDALKNLRADQGQPLK